MSRLVNQQLNLEDILKQEFNLVVSPRDKFSCKNPTHRDSDASCVYYGPERGTYCWGCGKSYWGLDFIMFSRGITYYEALKVAETEFGAELPNDGDGVKEVNSADKNRYEKLFGVSIKNKKQLHNLCLALNAVAEEDDASFNKYCEMKGITND